MRDDRHWNEGRRENVDVERATVLKQEELRTNRVKMSEAYGLNLSGRKSMGRPGRRRGAFKNRGRGI